MEVDLHSNIGLLKQKPVVVWLPLPSLDVLCYPP